MEGLVGLIINLLVGAAGGNLAGMLMPDKSLGVLWNSVVGIVGGGLGYFLLGLIGLAAFGLVGELIASFVGGAVLLYVVSMVQKS